MDPLTHQAAADWTHRNAALQTAAAELVEMHEQVKIGLSYQLLDNLGQLLAVLRMRLGYHMAQGPAEAADPDMLENLALLDDIIGEIRQVAAGLRIPLLQEYGLEMAVRQFMQVEATRTECPRPFASNLGTTRLSVGLEATCFRIIQAAVATIEQVPAVAAVSLDRQPIHLHLTIQATVPAGSASIWRDMGATLRAIQIQVLVLGGTLEIPPAADEILHLRIVFPLEPPRMSPAGY